MENNGRRCKAINHNLNTNDCGGANKDSNVFKEAKLRMFRSKTEHNYKEQENDHHDENLDDVHELNTATK